MCFDINSNFHFQNNEVLTQNKNQTKTIRGREITCDGELKNTTSKYINPKYSYKKHNDSSTYKVELKEITKNQERERIIIFFTKENNKFIENKMRWEIVKIKDIVINTKLSKSCYVIYNIIFLYIIFIMK